DAIVRLERVSLSIERQKFLALARKSHINAVLQFIGIESMRRLTELKHHEIRDVDDVVDRANADALNFRAQPLRAGTHFYVVNFAQREEWAFAACRDGNGAGAPPGCFSRTRRERRGSSQRRDFTREAEMAQQITAVWRDLDVQNRIRWEEISDRHANFCIGRQ